MTATGDGIARWLLPASLLHAALIVLAALVPGAGPMPERAAPALRAPESDASSELSLLDDAVGPIVARTAPALPVHLGAALTPANELPRAERVAGVQPRTDAARSAAEPLQPATGSQIEVVEGTTPPPAANEALREASPTLSLDQLGVGTNPFLGIAIAPLSKEEQVNARLYAALHPPSAERERQRGLGPAGPIADAARRLVLADDTLAETNAVFNVRVDGSGRVTEVHVLDASSQVKAWQMIAARLAKALEPVMLRAEAQQGWSMRLRLASTVQLPSGAAPGMRVGVLGQQVAGSGGPRSTSLELSPSAKLDIKEPIDTVGRHLDSPMRFEVMLLKLRADPTDIGAAARRVVEVAVLSMDPPGAH